MHKLLEWQLQAVVQPECVYVRERLGGGGGGNAGLTRIAMTATYSGINGCEAMKRSKSRVICSRPGTLCANHVMSQLRAK